jgi:hypothetical protein
MAMIAFVFPEMHEIPEPHHEPWEVLTVLLTIVMMPVIMGIIVWYVEERDKKVKRFTGFCKAVDDEIRNAKNLVSPSNILHS